MCLLLECACGGEGHLPCLLETGSTQSPTGSIQPGADSRSPSILFLGSRSLSALLLLQTHAGLKLISSGSSSCS